MHGLSWGLSSETTCCCSLAIFLSLASSRSLAIFLLYISEKVIGSFITHSSPSLSFKGYTIASGDGFWNVAMDNLLLFEFTTACVGINTYVAVIAEVDDEGTLDGFNGDPSVAVIPSSLEATHLILKQERDGSWIGVALEPKRQIWLWALRHLPRQIHQLLAVLRRHILPSFRLLRPP
ncbi:hypothetical protein G2W53_036402 [Senna tora]|uniref:Uncharacterized protein n=1 Tax=Senna tora TaxID=362788 RepID=A0A834WA73_9FABA|nr:hypothetical protein G2W53_036402 [Senna tora]